MSETKHTPGPWRSSGFRGGKTSLTRGQKIEAELGCVNGLSAWFTIAYVYERDREEELMSEGALGPAGADARLISAAPDYAAAVEQMLTYEQSGGDAWWKGWEMLKAAHAKATSSS